MAKKHTGSGAAVGVGLAALAAAAAGAYFLYGKDATKRRKQVRGWALRAKGEVLEAIEQLPNINETNYRAMIDRIMRRYQSVRQASPAEVTALSKELKSHWRSIHKHLMAAGKDVRRSATRVGSRATKGATKKRARRGTPKRRRATRRR
jgi:hypothetical protein